VYKLEEIQRRFAILKRHGRVLDVGAAPGSWSQLAARIVGSGGTVVAVDLQPISSVGEGVTSIVGDILDAAVVDKLRTLGPYDAIISDAAPKTSGNRTVDTARSSGLVEQVISLCHEMLLPDGNLVAKLFQGGEEQRLLSLARSLFGSVRMVKPKASRSESFETFLVAIGYTGRTLPP
jgi:23S rRNA (uridine2552-2'-O)-methyltransferase